MSRRWRRLAGVLALVAGLAQAEIYQWRDADGRLHLGDRPPPAQAAEKVQLRPINTISSPSVTDVVDDLFPPTPDVVMYSARWCGVCKRAKRYFQAQGIAFKEYDVETSAKGRRDFERLGGRGVPVILVGGKRMNGFDQRRFEAMRAAAREGR